MKKIAVIIVFSSLFLEIIGYQVIFYLRQSEIREEMEEAIRRHPPDADVQQFVFSVNDKNTLNRLEWDGPNEFSLDDNLYDVIEKKIEDGRLFIRCLSDKRETSLVTKAKGNWKDPEKRNKNADELFQLLQTLFHQSNSEGLVEITGTNPAFGHQMIKLPSLLKLIPTPPPQFA